MAITKRIYPTYPTINHNVSQSIYPEYYTCTSDDNSYSDFKYKFELYTTDGLVNTSMNPALIDEGLGVYNANKFIQNEFDVYFNPEITTWNAIPDGDSMIQYYVNVEEYSVDIAAPDNESFTKVIAIKNSVEGWNYLDYVLNDTDKHMLTNHSDITLELSLNDVATKRFLNGAMVHGTAGTSFTQGNNSLVNQITMTVTKPTGWIHYYRFRTSNPYYNYSTTAMSSGDQTLESMLGRMLDFPVGPKQIMAMKWDYVGNTSPAGVYTGYSYPYSLNLNTLEVDDEYTIQSYTWPYGTNGRTSYPYKFKVVDECSSRDRILLSWETQLGGFDYFIMDRKSDKVNSISKSHFRKVRDSVTSDYDYTHDVYDRGETTYHTKIDTNYIVVSDWVTDEEVLYLEDLFYSKNVFARIDDIWYPIILTNDTVMVNSSRKQLRNYTIDFRLSNKKYI